MVAPEIYPNFEQRLLGKTGLQKLAMTALPFIPRHAYHPFLSEVRIALTRLVHRPSRVKRLYRDLRDLIVNIGPGLSARPDWVNVDIFKFPGVNCIYDCRKALPFSDSAVRGIFTEHFFEHIDYIEEAPIFLAECLRVLQPGGVIRIIVPDVEKYIRAYCADGWEELIHVRPLKPDHTDVHFGSRFNTKMEVLNAVFRQYFEHKYAYDFPTLEYALQRVGFSDIRKQEFGKSLLPDLCIDSPDRVSESLYVEAVKNSSSAVSVDT
jgi:predicted SAM-dependent methyltransferase